MSRPGFELPLLLLAGFRTIVDEAHRRIAEQGHPGVRAAHGFAMQAVGDGATASEVARRLGVTKQAAAKTIGQLVERGYVVRTTDLADARRKVIEPTPRGQDMLRRSATIFEEIHRELADTIGQRRLDRLHDDLARLAGDDAFRVDSLSRLTITDADGPGPGPRA